MLFGLFRDPTAADEYAKDVSRLRSKGLDDARIAKAEWEKAKALMADKNRYYWGADIAHCVVHEFKAPEEACLWCASYYAYREDYANAFHLYKLLADKGNIKAMKEIGRYGERKIAGVTEEMGEAYYAKAMSLGDIECKMRFAQKLRDAGDRMAAIDAFKEVVAIGKQDCDSAQQYISQIYGLTNRYGNCEYQCVFCRKWFDYHDISFCVKELCRIPPQGRCVCWQCWGAYDQESVNHMIDIYWGWERSPEKYSAIIEKFKVAWSATNQSGTGLKSMDWEKIVRNENPHLAYVKPCVCCERTVDKRQFTDIRFSGGDTVLCRHCLEDYDLDSLLRVVSHNSPCLSNWREHVVELKSKVPVKKALKSLGQGPLFSTRLRGPVWILADPKNF